MNIELRKKELTETFLYRYSVKEFDQTKKINEDDFNFILEAGRLSPSSIGLEPWQFIILQNEDLRKKIADISFGAKGQLPTASHIVVILVRKDTQYNSEYVNYIAREIRNLPPEKIATIPVTYRSFQEIDIEVLDNERALIDWSGKQTYIALANMMTAAAHIGIDSCAIEGFNYKEARKILSDSNILNDNIYDISVIVAFGYRKEGPKRPKSRRALSEMVQWVE